MNELLYSICISFHDTHFHNESLYLHMNPFFFPRGEKNETGKESETGKKWVAGRGSGPAQGLSRGSPKRDHQNEPKCLKNQGFSCFWDDFWLPSRGPSWPQILAPSPINREPIFFPRWPEMDRNRAQMMLKPMLFLCF